jgi:hypothetical protein
LKILPASFTHDPDRLARFRREAQILAALNHPHIGAIYGLDDANGQQFLVLEGTEPRWRRDGKELFYLAGTPAVQATATVTALMAVEVRATQSTFDVGVPQVLFKARVLTGGAGVGYPSNSYAVTGDGQRFLVVSLVGETASEPITVVVNWTAGLKK